MESKRTFLHFLWPCGIQKYMYIDPTDPVGQALATDKDFSIPSDHPNFKESHRYINLGAVMSVVECEFNPNSGTWINDRKKDYQIRYGDGFIHVVSLVEWPDSGDPTNSARFASYGREEPARKMMKFFMGK